MRVRSARKAAEDCRTPRPSEFLAAWFIAKRLGVRQSSAAFGANGPRAPESANCSL